jgi:hypothetical protein
VRDAAVHERFNLHASVHLAAHGANREPTPALAPPRSFALDAETTLSSPTLRRASASGS